jgi:hypothetical protein
MCEKEADQLLLFNALKVLVDRNSLLSFIVKHIRHFLHQVSDQLRFTVPDISL